MKKLQRSVYFLLLIYLIVAGLYFAADFLIPLVLAGVFAMLFIGLSNWFERKGMNRAISALLSVLIFVTSAALIIFLLSWQLGSFLENFDEMKKQVTERFYELRQWISDTFNLGWKQQEEMVKQQGSEGSGQVGGMAASLAGGLMSFLVDTILFLVYMFLLLYYRRHIRKFIMKLVPGKDENRAETIVFEASRVTQKYLGGLAAMIVILWIMYGIGFSILGMEGALFFALLCGTLEIVPFVGNITGTSLALLGAVAQGGDSSMILGVIAVYFIVQFIQTYFLETLVVGENVSINPLFTIMGLVVGEMIWGIAGMILAIPLLGIAKILWLSDRKRGSKGQELRFWQVEKVAEAEVAQNKNDRFSNGISGDYCIFAINCLLIRTKRCLITKRTTKPIQHGIRRNTALKAGIMNLLSKLSLLPYDVLGAVIFKASPNEVMCRELRKQGFVVHHIPPNPYI
jgi:predicted PurR-regulated permease PerM